jgi:hypothetical protein
MHIYHPLVIDNVQVSSHQFVLQACPIRNHNLVPLIGDNDTRPSESHTLAKPHIP